MNVRTEYFYGREADQFVFYRLPKLLIVCKQFEDISYGAKILYGLLLDRMGLSLLNSWYDNDGRAYIIYSVAEIQQDMNCSKATAVKMMKELETSRLLEKKRRRTWIGKHYLSKKVCC